MHQTETVRLARLPSGIPITTTIHWYGQGGPDASGAGTVESGDGPVVYVQAAQHGREVNGVEVLRRLHDQLVDTDLDGTVVAVPVADPLTFDRVSYTTPESLDSVHSNMNRCWPGDEDGTLHERMAATLWRYASEADAIVDLHTGSPEMLTHTVYLEGDADSRRLAEAFGTEVLLAEAAGDDSADPVVTYGNDTAGAESTGESDTTDHDREWEKRDFGGKFRVAATRDEIPAITPELAHSRELVEPAIRAGLEGMTNLLRELDVLDGPAEPWSGTVARNHLGRVKADDSGLFVLDPGVELGGEIATGEHLGTLYHPTSYDVLQEVAADRDGILYSVTREATVTAGATLVGVAERIE